MKTLQLLFFTLFAIPSLILAQDSKIAQYYEKGDYEKCMKFCEKALDKDSKNLEATLYQAMVYTQWTTKGSEDKGYKMSEANARNKALNELIRLRKKDRNRSFQYKNQDGYNFVRSNLLRYADQLAATKEMAAAQEFYLKLMNGMQDWTINFYVGCSWIKYNDPRLGLRYLNMGMKEYQKLFKQNSQGPEPAVFEHILEAVEGLSDRGAYLPALSTFGFIDLFYDRKKDKTIDETYLLCLKIAMNNIKPTDTQRSKLLLEYEKALDRYPQEEELKEWKIALIQNTLDWFAEDLYAKDKTIETVENSYRFMLDSMKNNKTTLEQINNIILAKIYKLYPQDEDKKRAKSLVVYDFFKAINLNKDYNKKEDIVEQFLIYGTTKNDLGLNATALLIYKEKEAKMSRIADKMTILEEKVAIRAQGFTTDYTDFDELMYWLKEFPEFETIKKTAHGYFLSNAKQLIEAKEFSKAGLFLRRGQAHFPEEETFKKLKRQCVEKDYEINYLGSEINTEVLAWTGSVETCDPGEISKVAQERMVQRYDFARRLLGFPDGTVFNDTESKYCQAGALCMSAQGELSHKPDETWKCYSKDAARGAHNSLGIGFMGAIFGMIEDSGPHNKATGHRGNLLTPYYKGFVYGATNNTVALSATGHKKHADEVLKRFDTDFISWPPQGPVPNKFVFNRWSFKSYNHNFTFENPTVKMYLDGKEIEVEIEHETSTKIGWVPAGLNNRSEKEQTVKVVVELDVKRRNKTDAKREKFEYDVIIFPIKK